MCVNLEEIDIPFHGASVSEVLIFREMDVREAKGDF
jgi:hypothetical protein